MMIPKKTDASLVMIMGEIGDLISLPIRILEQSSLPYRRQEVIIGLQFEFNGQMKHGTRQRREPRDK